MRKFIVKFFALDYIYKGVTWTRSANIIFPLMLLNMAFGLLDVSDWLQYVGMALLFIALFIGFVYFKIKPLTENDFKYMDKVQLMQYHKFYKSYTEVVVYENTIVSFLVNPIAVLIFILLILAN